MNKLRIYLDNCCFNRPFDDQRFLSIFHETQAKLIIQDLVKNDMFTLIWSFIIDFENSANPDANVKDEIFAWKTVSSVMIYSETEILTYAKELTRSGFGKKDALHIACAHKAKADFFITVDKGIIRKANLVNSIKILSPMDFITYLEEKNED
ncbi:MAG: PIN domain protein [Candidatus Scalindua sp.]